MFPDWPVEAYAAQAIFVEFYHGLHTAGGVKTVRSGCVHKPETQAFNAEAVTDDIRRAVEMTREVMVYETAMSGVPCLFGWLRQAKEGLDYQEEPPFTKSVELPDNEYARMT